MAQATAHCSAFVSGGSAGWGFTQKKGEFPVLEKEQEAFNRQYGQKLMAEHGIAPAKTCVLDVVSRKTEERSRFPQAPSHHRAMPPPDREIAVAQGVLDGSSGHVPVSIAYRFERTAADMPWRLMNVSLNGQPLDAFGNP